MPDGNISFSFGHFLVFTDDMDGTVKWYGDVLGMKPGPMPDFQVPVTWLYLGDQPLLHVVQWEDDRGVDEAYVGKVNREVVSGGGRIDHIAFDATGLTDVLARLDSLGIDYIERRVDINSRYQLFFHDPNGIKVELDFSADEAGDRKPPAMFEELAAEMSS
jgi:catechol 2,3-dioxygenase-like lactoylglutathione lyase family enzyme